MIATFNKVLLLLMITAASAREGVRGGLTTKAKATLQPVNLGAAGNFAILAKTGISTVPESEIDGDIGVSPIAAAAMTGFSFTLASNGEYSTSDQVTGKCYAADYIGTTPSELETAVLDMQTAYMDARSRPNTDAERINFKGGDLSGQTLTPGVYTFKSSVVLTADVYFDGGENDIFIIQSTGVLFVADSIKLHLTGGVQAKNVFWQFAGNVVIGTNAVIQGILLVKTDVLLSTGATLIGSALSQTAVNLQMAAVTKQ